MITEEDKLASLVMNAFTREIDIQSYQINIDNYTFMLESLPQGEWDEDISPYFGKTVADLPHSLTDEQVERFNDFQYRDHLRYLIRTEKAEQNKTIRIRDALKNQIGENYDSLLQQFKQSQQ